MKNKNSKASRWLLVSLFSVLGLGLLTGSAFAQEDAQAQQVGDNDVVVEQETTAKSGDSVAGSQVVGVVGGSPTIQGQNSSSGATATSGDVTAVNDLTVNAGPSATTTAAPAENGPVILSSHGGEAQAQQIGDNNVVVDQETNVSSGDCVAGSTVTGVVGSDAVIQNQNSSTGATCTSGDVTAVNSLIVNAGPSVVILPPPPPPGEEEPPPLGEADVGLLKSTEDTEVAPGGTITYDIRVGNAPGSAPAEGVTWTDTIPAGTTFESLSAPAGWVCDTPAVGGTGTVTCSRDGPMDAGLANVEDFVLVVRVDDTVAPDTVITNTATASAENPDPNPGNNTGSASSTVVAPASADLSVSKTGVLVTTTPRGVEYTATVTNNGPDAAENVTFTDTLDADTTWQGFTEPVPMGWACLEPAIGSTGTVTCTKASMTNGESATFEYVAQPTSAGTSPWTNDAGVTSETDDPEGMNDTASATVSAP